MKKTHFSTAFLLFFLVQTWASDVVEVLPLTNKILMVRFDDGYVIYHKSGQKRTQESMVVDPLDIAKATTLSSFSLTSSDDAAYSSAKNPTEIGRKSKGTSVSHMCEGWGGSDVGCVNTNPDHAKEHWLYLYLPTALQSGKSYTITLSNLAKNKNTFTFKYDETTLRSESIHVNNIGYSTAATSKYGYVYQEKLFSENLNQTSKPIKRVTHPIKTLTRRMSMNVIFRVSIPKGTTFYPWRVLVVRSLLKLGRMLSVNLIFGR
jgi:hypothetical protein